MKKVLEFGFIVKTHSGREYEKAKIYIDDSINEIIRELHGLGCDVYVSSVESKHHFRRQEPNGEEKAP